MRIALTGSSGGIGRAIAAQALREGHELVAIDRVAPAAAPEDGVTFIEADTSNYDRLVEAFAGCDALIHMAAIPVPGRQPDHVVHNNNVVGSYNALRAAAENGITRICQASSVNAIGHAFSREPHYDYFPIDELHTCYCEDPYSLSKWICEQQAAAMARRYEGMSIASLRFHWVVPHRARAAERFRLDSPVPGTHLWAYTRSDAAADACLKAVGTDLGGHEAFYIVAPDTCVDVPSARLAARHFPGVPIKGAFESNCSFFSSAKAERMLGWRHPSARECDAATAVAE